MRKFFYKKEKGFMAVEILVAVSIIALSVLASTTVAQKSLTVSRRAVSNAQATFLLEEGAELIRLYRDSLYPYSDSSTDRSVLSTGQDYYLHLDPDSRIWEILDSDPNDIPNFTRKINFENVYRDSSTWDIVSGTTANQDPGKFATVTVTQEEAGEIISTKSITFYINRLLFE